MYHKLDSLSGVVEQSLLRTQEATLGVLDIVDDNLRSFLRNQISLELGNENCFLADPVVEHTFGWETSDITFKDLCEDKGGKIFTQSMIALLGSKKTPEEYRFSDEMRPYKHQIEAWKALTSKQIKSTIITTGTGSGKTECFMLPILDSLITQHEETKQPLVGVQALFLYPLNALINSQRERLNAWTRQFGNNIRFCLYNGNTQEVESVVRKAQKEQPNQVLSRELLRREPSPILMTNATMLEYMLVRQFDFPILQKSKENKTLRWIVLDEAHTYIGSQAAEISLLLRRVIHSFGKKPEDIRFIATSATISSSDGSDKLKTYLAELAGICPEQVEVISGKRIFDKVPIGRDAQSIEEIRHIDSGKVESEERYNALANNRIACTIRKFIVESDIPLTLNKLIEKCQCLLQADGLQKKQREMLAWLDLMTQTKNPHNATLFLKLRLHLFQKMFNGLWACIDSNCSHKSNQLGDWGFGQVYIHHRDRCECGAPVYELALCKECNKAHLLAEDSNGTLKQQAYEVEDEFELDGIQFEENDETDSDVEYQTYSKTALVLADECKENYNFQYLDKKTAEIGIGDISINFAYSDMASCINCTKESRNYEFYRTLHLGAPFYITNAVPTVLEFCPQDEINGNKPAGGRKLITFTDSRQGTARMAVKMQQEAERNKFRGLLFEILVNECQSGNRKNKIKELEGDIEQLKSLNNPAFNKMIADREREREELEQFPKISWEDMLDKLSGLEAIEHHILPYNKTVNPRMFDDSGARTLSRLLLAREFRRRPKNANSMESLGLVAVGYDGLLDINTMPQYWEETRVAPFLGSSEGRLDIKDWRAFLKMLLDFYIRENSYVKMDRQMSKWLGAKFYAKYLLPPESKQQDKVRKKWPVLSPARISRPIKILQIVTGFDLNNFSCQDKINEWLKTAWQQLTRESGILQSDENSWSLPLDKLTFTLLQNAWLCPITNSVIDSTLRGISPYLSSNYADNPQDFLCKKTLLPDYSVFRNDGTSTPRQAQMRNLLSQDEQVQQLRDKNLWNNLHDRIVEGGFYYRSAEHSAQQNAKRLEDYEKEFKEGKINVLSCSTTMEMGVDIGGISAVVMNNVPPHPANYLQRSGRAGRRNEARALAYTLCKSDPHNQRVFKDTLWPFAYAIKAPTVSLSSQKLVARHVNSLLLASFLHQQENKTNNLTLTTLWFFNSNHKIYENFCDWIGDGANDVDKAIERLVFGSVLQGKRTAEIKKDAIEKINHLALAWQAELEKMKNKINKIKKEDDSYKKALKREKKNHEKEYLLRYLAVHAFLPGYGFPTDVVNLNISKHSDSNRNQYSREDNSYQYREFPSRSLDIALREYAPGSQVVIDGNVYCSAGVNLRSKSDGRGKNEEQNFDISWRCKNCGTAGLTENAYTNAKELSCYRCGEHIPLTEQKITLIPSGFLTDYYDDTSNDVSTQKFIKTEVPLVQLNGDYMALPQAKLGFVHYGHKGEVFYHSAGEYGNGYAICLVCGRGDSMSKDKGPPSFASQEYHRPLGGGSELARFEETCSREAIKDNIYLGHHAKTDVLELGIRNPETGQWLGECRDDKDRTIARTLAVALRNEIAQQIGVDCTEMGYASRVELDIDSESPINLIQVYDKVNGGAGFSLSVIENITEVLKSSFERLNCPMDCEAICSHCLSANDGKVEQDNINRKEALEWLKLANFKKYLSVPESIKKVSGSNTVLNAIQFIERRLRNKQSYSIKLYFDDKFEEWDIDDPNIFEKLCEWKFRHKTDVCLCFPEEVLTQIGVKKLLRLFVHSGFKILSYKKQDINNDNIYISAQLSVDNGKVETLLSEGSTTIFDSKKTAIYVANTIEALKYSIVDTASWYQDKKSEFIKIHKQLDGSLADFGQKFAKLLKKETAMKAHLDSETVKDICYTDRYLKSPVTILLLKTILAEFTDGNQGTLTINTLACQPSYKQSRFVWDDWQSDDRRQEVYSKWFGKLVNHIEINILENSRELPHGRFLELTWTSGKKTMITFDQGMGYWNRHNFSNGKEELRFFPFYASVEEQTEHLEKCIKTDVLNITTNYNWHSYVAVSDETN